MTSKTSILTGSGRETFPDFPPRDDMQNWLYLYDTSIVTALALHLLAYLPDAIVASEVPVGPTVSNRDDVRIPDLLVSLLCNRRTPRGAARLLDREPGQAAGLRAGGRVPIDRAE